MKICILFLTFILVSCASTDEDSIFTFSEKEISSFKQGYLNRNVATFPFVLVATTGPSGQITIEKPDSGNLNLLSKYGVLYLAIANEEGYVIHKKLIAGYKNMRGNNALFINQVVNKIQFNKEDRNGNREFVIPIALTYPLETF